MLMRTCTSAQVDSKSAERSHSAFHVHSILTEAPRSDFYRLYADAHVNPTRSMYEATLDKQMHI